MKAPGNLQFFKALYENGLHYLCLFERKAADENQYTVEVEIVKTGDAGYKKNFVVTIKKENGQNHWNLTSPNPSISRDMERRLSDEINVRG